MNTDEHGWFKSVYTHVHPWFFNGKLFNEQFPIRKSEVIFSPFLSVFYRT